MSVSVLEMSGCGLSQARLAVCESAIGRWLVSPGLQMWLQMVTDGFAGRLTPATVGRETGHPGRGRAAYSALSRASARSNKGCWGWSSPNFR